MLGLGSVGGALQIGVVIAVVVLAVAAVIGVGYLGNLAYKKWMSPSLEKPEVKKSKKCQSESDPKKSTPIQTVTVPASKRETAPKFQESKSKIKKSKPKKSQSMPVSKFCLGKKVDATNLDLEAFIKLCEAKGLDFSKIPQFSLNLNKEMGNYGYDQITLEDFSDTSMIWGRDLHNNFFVSYLHKENNTSEVRTIYQDSSWNPVQWRKQYPATQSKNAWNASILNLELEVAELVTYYQPISDRGQSLKARMS